MFEEDLGLWITFSGWVSGGILEIVDKSKRIVDKYGGIKVGKVSRKILYREGLGWGCFLVFWGVK